MTADVVGSATVTIDADFSTFDEQIQRKLVTAARKAGKDAEKTLAKSGTKAGDEFGDNLSKTVTKKASKAGNDSGGFFSKAFQSAAAKGLGTALFRTVAISAAGLITALSPISTLLGGAVAAAVALTAAIGQAAGAAISLAGVLASLGLALAAVKVGFSGVGDAVKEQSKALAELNATGEISAATQEKLDAALKNLAPSARAVVQQLAVMAPAWKAVQQSVQERLFRNVGAVIQTLGSRFLPVLREQLTRAAGTLNQTAVSLGRFLASTQTANRVNEIFTSLNGILATLLPVVQPLAAAFLSVFSASLPFAQQLADSIRSLGERFAAFLQSSVASGKFTEFLQNATDAAKTLIDFVVSLGRVLGTIFSAGTEAGGNLLTLLTDLLDRVGAFLKSTEGQAALASFFGLIASAGQILVGVFETLRPLLAGIGALFDALRPALATLGAALVPVIAQLAEALGGALTALAPALAQLVVAFGPLVTVVGSLLAGAIQTLAPILVLLVQNFAQMLPVLTPIIAALGGALLSAVAQLLPLFVQLAPVAVQFAQALGAGLLTVIQALLPSLPVLVDALVQILAATIQLLPALLPLIPPLAQLSVSFAQILVTLAPLIVAIAQLAAGILIGLAPALVAIVGFVAGAISAFAQLVAQVASVLAVIVNFVAQIIAKFTELLTSGSSIFGALAGAIRSAVSGLVGPVVGFFSSMVSRALAVLTGFISSAAEAAGEVASGIIDAIESGLSGVAAAFRGPFDAARDAVASAVAGIVSVVSGAVDKIQGLVSKISGAVSKVSGFNFPGINIPGFRNGGIIDRPQIIAAGEGGKREVVIPLTKPQRAQQLMRQTGLDKMATGPAPASSKTQTFNVPIQAGTVVDQDALVERVKALLISFGFTPKIGIQTAGGTL